MNADITVTVIITQNPLCLTLDKEDFAKKNYCCPIKLFKPSITY